MINLSGLKVYPAEVENVIYQHPAVAEVAIYGISDRLQGKLVKANYGKGFVRSKASARG